MKKETIAYAKIDISKVIAMTEDEKLIKYLWSFINGYFSKKPKGVDPRNQVEKLISEFWNSKESEVNMCNVKDKLIESINEIHGDYESNLQFLHSLYCMTEAYFISENTASKGVCNE